MHPLVACHYKFYWRDQLTTTSNSAKQTWRERT